MEEVKPFVDANYPTLPDQRNTFIMGSSMGGLISLYAVSQYPDVFYGAGCVSTHWAGGTGRTRG
ncbi:MAG: alpha/beta hydrolase-fold protein [Candidatus Moduliflexus flocculans]|nr:alpha/beta hydrolase-fold protein [Candidatus Moduliflexus flocculans]